MINLFTMKFFQFFFNAVIDSAPNAVFTVNNLKSENKKLKRYGNKEQRTAVKES